MLYMEDCRVAYGKSVLSCCKRKRFAMIGRIMRTTYICTLDGKIQSAIRSDLTELGLCAEDISRAMSSRLCDLEDTIEIGKYL